MKLSLFAPATFAAVAVASAPSLEFLCESLQIQSSNIQRWYDEFNKSKRDENAQPAAGFVVTNVNKNADGKTFQVTASFKVEDASTLNDELAINYLKLSGVNGVAGADQIDITNKVSNPFDWEYTFNITPDQFDQKGKRYDENEFNQQTKYCCFPGTFNILMGSATNQPGLQKAAGSEAKTFQFSYKMPEAEPDKLSTVDAGAVTGEIDKRSKAFTKRDSLDDLQQKWRNAAITLLNYCWDCACADESSKSSSSSSTTSVPTSEPSPKPTTSVPTSEPSSYPTTQPTSEPSPEPTTAEPSPEWPCTDTVWVTETAPPVTVTVYV